MKRSGYISVSYQKRFLVESAELPMTEPPEEPQYEPVYRAVMPEGAHPELVEEEFDLFRRMTDRLGDRIPEDATPEETKALLDEAMSQDEELAAIAERFNEVIYSHKGSVIRKMMEYDERMGRWP
jgi:hypothetical protein